MAKPVRMNKAHRGLLIAIIASVLSTLSACATGQNPDLARLYQTNKTPSHQTAPVIVIPGILGSRLRNRETGEEVWPGSIVNALIGDHNRLALSIDPETLEPVDDGIEADGIFDQLSGNDFYGKLLTTLEQYGQFQRTEPGTKVSDQQRRYYVFAYDWRQDNVLTARKLDALIEQIRSDHNDPDLRVNIVAHSMGGLITRYYLRYGTTDVLNDNELRINYDGVKKVGTTLLLGTPNLGSVSSLHAFIQGEKVGLTRINPETFATIPSAYQLFPHPLADWLITADGKNLDRDIFAPRIWQAFQWSVYDPDTLQRIRDKAASAEAARIQTETLQRYFDKTLSRARRFVWALTRQLDASPERIVVFGGNCAPTPARLLVEEINGESVIRLRPNNVRTADADSDYATRMIEPGDGQVTKASLLGRTSLDPSEANHPYAVFPLAYSMFLCENHNKLTGNISFQDNLLNVLLSRARPFDQADPVSIIDKKQ